MYTTIEPLQHKIREAQDFMRSKNYPAAIELLGDVVDYLPWDPIIRDLRADAYLGAGNVIHAISDIRSTTKLR